MSADPRALEAPWHELPDCDVCRLRAEIGMVFQCFNLLPHTTALDNVVEAPTRVLDEDKESAVETPRALLEQVGLADKATSYPNQLSGGQQRVAIARALARKPKLMIFDAPRSPLDPGLVGDQLVFIYGGVIVEAGNPRELLVNPQHERTKAFLSKVL
jgi:polar amino acid transport system ATP-binding protein